MQGTPRRRSWVHRWGLGPHGIALLLAITLILPSRMPWASSRPAMHGPLAGTPECAVLDEFLADEQLQANFQGTPSELDRWVTLYDADCR